MPSTMCRLARTRSMRKAYIAASVSSTPAFLATSARVLRTYMQLTDSKPTAKSYKLIQSSGIAIFWGTTFSSTPLRFNWIKFQQSRLLRKFLHDNNYLSSNENLFTTSEILRDIHYTCIKASVSIKFNYHIQIYSHSSCSYSFSISGITGYYWVCNFF